MPPSSGTPQRDGTRQHRWRNPPPASPFIPLLCPKGGGQHLSSPSNLTCIPSPLTPESPTIWWHGEHCHCLALLKGNAVGFLQGVLKKKKKCWFWSSLICFRWSGISHMFCYQSIILMSCSCVDTFCNERSSVESEQHLIKSVCVKQHCAKRTSKDVIIIPRQMMSPCRKTEMPNLLFIF